MPIIDYNELIQAQRQGLNRYIFQQPTYKKKEQPRFIEDASPSGFHRPTGNPGWEQTGAWNYSRDMTPEQLKKSGKDAYLKTTIKPGDVLNKYFPGWQEREAEQAAARKQMEDWQRMMGSSPGGGFEMPEAPSFEDIYGMTQEDWQAEQVRKQDISNLEAAWSTRKAALTSAMEEVDKRIRQTESYAAMTGQRLTIDDKQRKAMIEGMFAKMYPMEQEEYVQSIIKKYGLGEEYQSPYARGSETMFGEGDTSVYNAVRKGGTVGVPSTILTDEEESLGGDELVLG